MIDISLIEELDPDDRVAVSRACIVLATTGVLEAQKARLLAQIAEGSETEDLETLAQRILEYRIKSHGLSALQILGQKLEREQ